MPGPSIASTVSRDVGLQYCLVVKRPICEPLPTLAVPIEALKQLRLGSRTQLEDVIQTWARANRSGTGMFFGAFAAFRNRLSSYWLDCHAAIASAGAGRWVA